MKTVAIIPARGGSKGIPHKNIVDLWDKPLIAYMLEAAQEAKLVDEVYVLTNDTEIVNATHAYGGTVMKRAPHTCTDEASTEAAMQDFVFYQYADWTQIDKLVLLQATSPLTTSEDIDEAIRHMDTGGVAKSWDSVVSVCRDHGGPLCGGFRWGKKGYSDEAGVTPMDYILGGPRPRRQAAQPTYRENGAIYVTKIDSFISSGSRVSGEVRPYVMPRQRSFEIDSMEDLEELRERSRDNG